MAAEIQEKKSTAFIKSFVIFLLIAALIVVAGMLVLRNYDIKNLKLVTQNPVTNDAENTQDLNDDLEDNKRDVSALKTTTSDLEHRLKELENNQGELKAKVLEHNYYSLAASDVEAMKVRFDDLFQRQKALEDRIASAASALSDAHFAMLNSLWLLQYRLDYGLPFRNELRNLKTFSRPVADITSELDKLAPYEDSGIRTTPDLIADFETVAREVRKLSGAYAPGKNPLEGFLINITQIAEIRRTDAVNSSGKPDDVLKRAEGFIRNYDINPGILELENLPENFKPATNEWVRQAKARLEAEDTIAGIYELIITSFEKQRQEVQ